MTEPSDGKKRKVAKGIVAKSESDILDEEIAVFLNSTGPGSDITKETDEHATTVHTDSMDTGNEDRTDTGNKTHAPSQPVGRDMTTNVDSIANTVHESGDIKTDDQSVVVKQIWKNRISYNSKETLDVERESMNAGYLGDPFEEYFYTDINLPTDINKRFNQGLKRSKDLNTIQAEHLVEEVEKYKKSGKSDRETELLLMYWFGVLLKNVVDYKRSLINDVTAKIKPDLTKRIDSCGSVHNLAKTCVSAGYVIPENMGYSKPSLENRAKAALVFKRSMIFPKTDFPQTKSKIRKDYCAISFLYHGYNIVMFNVAESGRRIFCGVIPKVDGKPVWLVADKSASEEYPTMSDMIDGGCACYASRNRDRDAIKKIKVIDCDLIKDDFTETKSAPSKATKKKTKKKAVVKCDSYTLTSWIRKKDDVAKDSASEVAVVEDENQYYADNDKDCGGTTEDMIEVSLLARNVETNVTKRVPAYIKYRTTGIDIYFAYNSSSRTRYESVTFLPLDPSQMTDYEIYYKK